MKLFGREWSFRSGANPENPSTPLSAIAKWLGAGQQTVSGEEINHQIALQLVTVMACVRVLSESVASLPCVMYEHTSQGRKEVQGPLAFLLGTEPNSDMSAFTFWETMVGGCALTGNSYAQITRNGAGQIAELLPLHPEMTEPCMLPNGKLGFKTRQGETNGQWRYINSEDCLHFALFGLDGIKGISPVTAARQSLGLARAAEKYGAKHFGNGSKTSGILTMKSTDSGSVEADEMLAAARSSWEAMQGGSNQGRTAVLPGDWTYTPISMSPEDSQFLETRAFQRTEIAAMFRVPSHMVGDNSKISNNSYEQMALSFVQDTLRPIVLRMESEINRKLMPRSGSKAYKFFVEFDFTERLRGDHATQMTGLQIGLQWGFVNANEARRIIGMNPIVDPSGDAYMVQVNMMNRKRLMDEPEVVPAPPQVVPVEPPVDPKEEDPDGKGQNKDNKGTPKQTGANKKPPVKDKT